MHIGVLEIELLIDESRSLKDKRAIVRSLKDRLHREHQVSVSEVAAHDHQKFGVLGVTLAAPTHARASHVLDAIVRKVSSGTDYRVGGNRRTVRSSDEVFRSDLPPSEPAWDASDDAAFESLGNQAIEDHTR